MNPLWVDVGYVAHAPLESDLDVDLAIVGGGLSGIGAAFELRDSGARVAVLEAATVGSGASGRNGGFVLAGPAMEFSSAVRGIGSVAAQKIWHFTVENNRTLAALIEDCRIDCGYLRRGSMSLAASPEEASLLRASYRELTNSGVASSLVEAGDLPPPFHRSHFGGLYYPGNAEMNSGAFTRNIALSISDRIAIHERSPVHALRYRAGWHLTGPFGTVRADTVIVTTNAWSSSLIPGAPIESRRGQVAATAPLHQVLVPFPMYANYGFQYWRQTTDGCVVVGGWRDMDVAGETGLEDRLHDDIQSAIDNFLRLSLGINSQVPHRWCGLMGFTEDHFPLVGRVPGAPHLFIAAGYSGHGVSMAFRSGQQVALAAVGKTFSIPAEFDPAR